MGCEPATRRADQWPPDSSAGWRVTRARPAHLTVALRQFPQPACNDGRWEAKYETGMGTSGDDPGVIDAARRGERHAWEQLYRAVHPRLKAFLARKVGHRGAEDAVNETMTRAMAGIRGYKPGPAGFDGWIFGIARNVAADHYRRGARDRRQLDVAHRVDGGGPVGWWAVDDHVELQQDHARLRTAFEQLAPAEQEILELRVVAGLSAEQVGAVTGRTPGAVRTSQSRALAHLRHLMEADRVDA